MENIRKRLALVEKNIDQVETEKQLVLALLEESTSNDPDVVDRPNEIIDISEDISEDQIVPLNSSELTLFRRLNAIETKFDHFHAEKNHLLSLLCKAQETFETNLVVANHSDNTQDIIELDDDDQNLPPTIPDEVPDIHIEADEDSRQVIIPELAPQGEVTPRPERKPRTFEDLNMKTMTTDFLKMLMSTFGMKSGSRTYMISILEEEQRKCKSKRGDPVDAQVTRRKKVRNKPDKSVVFEWFQRFISNDTELQEKVLLFETLSLHAVYAKMKEIHGKDVPGSVQVLREFFEANGIQHSTALGSAKNLRRQNS